MVSQSNLRFPLFHRNLQHWQTYIIVSIYYKIPATFGNVSWLVLKLATKPWSVLYPSEWKWSVIEFPVDTTKSWSKVEDFPLKTVTFSALTSLPSWIVKWSQQFSSLQWKCFQVLSGQGWVRFTCKVRSLRWTRVPGSTVIVQVQLALSK